VQPLPVVFPVVTRPAPRSGCTPPGCGERSGVAFRLSGCNVMPRCACASPGCRERSGVAFRLSSCDVHRAPQRVCTTEAPGMEREARRAVVHLPSRPATSSLRLPSILSPDALSQPGALQHPRTPGSRPNGSRCADS